MNAKELACYSNEELETRIRQWEENGGWHILERNFPTFAEYISWAASRPLTSHVEEDGYSIDGWWGSDFTGTRAMKTELSRRLSRDVVHHSVGYDS
jgi:hypothetical protein